MKIHRSLEVCRQFVLLAKQHQSRVLSWQILDQDVDVTPGLEIRAQDRTE